MSNPTSPLTYPLAQRNGSIVKPDQANHGDDLVCFCGGEHPMIVRKGKVKKWHFAHRVNPGNACNGESALHNAAKRIIKEGFESARDQGTDYEIETTCRKCGHPVSKRPMDLPRQDRWHATHVELEKQLSPKVRPDLVFTKETMYEDHGFLDAQQDLKLFNVFAVEVVVSHGLTPQAKRELKRLGVPTLIVHPTWATIAELETTIRASSVWGTDTETNCSNCKRIRDSATIKLA